MRNISILWICFAFLLPQFCPAQSSEKPLLLGGDISMLTQLEESGVVFRDNDEPKDLIKLMSEYGCNCFRLRLFVNPNGRGGVIQDVPYTIALAKRIKAAGAVFMLDFHYSDTWADPSHQIKPEAWENLTFNELVNQVETYTADVITQFKRENVLPDMVQIGNEVTLGFIWPDGKLGGDNPDQQWFKFCKLLKAGVRGLEKSIDPTDKVRIIIHIDKGASFEKTDWFFTNLQKHKVPFDIIGLSYYPWWHGTLPELQENLTKTAQKFQKDIFVVETAYLNRPYDLGRAPLKDNMPWEQSPAGQKAFLCDVIQAVRNTPDHRGIGVLWWYPESVPIQQRGGWYDGAAALFDREGSPLPAMNCFKKHEQSHSED